MALTPTGTSVQGETRAELIRRITQPGSKRTAPPKWQKEVNAEDLEVLGNSTPSKGFRIRAATTPEQMEFQITRLSTLVANDNVDMSAPAGSYINFLL